MGPWEDLAMLSIHLEGLFSNNEAFIQHQRMFIKAQTNTRTGQTVQLHASSITRLYHAKTEEKALSLAHLILIQVHNIIRYKGTQGHYRTI